MNRKEEEKGPIVPLGLAKDRLGSRDINAVRLLGIRQNTSG